MPPIKSAPVENQANPSAIVRPSSLNYKISLTEAVVSFMNRDKLPE